MLLDGQMTASDLVVAFLTGALLVAIISIWPRTPVSTPSPPIGIERTPAVAPVPPPMPVPQYSRPSDTTAATSQIGIPPSNTPAATGPAPVGKPSAVPSPPSNTQAAGAPAPAGVPLLVPPMPWNSSAAAPPGQIPNPTIPNRFLPAYSNTPAVAPPVTSPLPANWTASSAPPVASAQPPNWTASSAPPPVTLPTSGYTPAAPSVWIPQPANPPSWTSPYVASSPGMYQYSSYPMSSFGVTPGAPPPMPTSAYDFSKPGMSFPVNGLTPISMLGNPLAGTPQPVIFVPPMQTIPQNLQPTIARPVTPVMQQATQAAESGPVEERRAEERKNIGRNEQAQELATEDRTWRREWKKRLDI